MSNIACNLKYREYQQTCPNRLQEYGRSRRLDNLVSEPDNYFSSSAQQDHVPVYASAFASLAVGANYLLFGDEAGILYISNSRDIALEAIQAHRNNIFDVQWHPNERRAVTASGDGTAAVWDLSTCQRTCLLASHSCAVRTAQYNKFDPAMLVTSSKDGAIMIWDTRCNGLISATHPSLDAMQSTQNSPMTIYNASDVMYRAHSSSAATKTSKSLKSKVLPLSCALFVADRLVVSSSSRDTVLRLWDVRMMGRHKSKNQSLPILTSDDLSRAFSSPDSKTSCSNHTQRRRYGVTHIALDASRSLLYASITNGSVCAVDAASLSSLFELTGACLPGQDLKSSFPTFSPSFYTRLAIHPSGEYIAAGSLQSCAIVWQPPPTKRLLWNQNGDSQTTNVRQVPMSILQNGHGAEVSSITFRQDGNDDIVLATCSDDSTVRLWKESAQDAQNIREFAQDRASGPPTLGRWGFTETFNASMHIAVRESREKECVNGLKQQSLKSLGQENQTTSCSQLTAIVEKSQRRALGTLSNAFTCNRISSNLYSFGNQNAANSRPLQKNRDNLHKSRKRTILEFFSAQNALIT